MSLLVDQKVRLTQSTDPRIDQDRKVSFDIESGPSKSSLQSVVSQSYNASQATFVVDIPNRQTFVSRRMLLTMPMSFLFTGTVAGGVTTLVDLAGTGLNSIWAC